MDREQKLDGIILLVAVVVLALLLPFVLDWCSGKDPHTSVEYHG